MENTALFSALAGLILILHLFLLLGTSAAYTIPFGLGPVACCGDARENSIRLFTVFGGSAAFDWGLPYWLLATLSSGWLAQFALAYAWMRFWASFIQTLLFLIQSLRVNDDRPFTLKAHLNGCGYTTAASPFWPLYWLSYISFIRRPVSALRDLLTRIDWVFSLPGILLLNAFTLLFKHRRVLPLIGPVVSPN